ncbi:DUF1360 domain-containing protein [Streptomyces sp. TG1A-8]|uniref:DUF1360 domain-containing protein n=1 Tax=Streptomyces sp. TG1A-8 TaxID=3051385 RepID=UPI00265BA3F6|nr:DUF1360 domain-containing protein [Streptomyces sp. TG1A-8]MDO0929254.1 DUF1360 domain-containing protein [Streptomyces sp. TG1A-8]
MTTDAGEYDDQGEVPLRGYATLASVFAAGIGAYALLARRRGVRLPQEVPPWDVVLLGIATYKTSRLLTRDKITSFIRAPFTRRAGAGKGNEVMDEPRGTGLQRSVGDLLACPFCTSAWTAASLVCSYAASPRLTRLVCGGLGAVTVADWMQYAWTWTQQTEDD